MVRLHRSQLSAFAAALLAVTAFAPAAYAFSGGITTFSFGAGGCNECHSGGTAPVVTLSGPNVVAPGSSHEYTLTILGNSMQNRGGLNVSTLDGVLSTGGAASANTQTLPGPSALAEITHTGPKLGDAWNVITFSFMWTAPMAFTSATLNAWGNAVNLSNSPTGDAASSDSLEIFSTTADSPTPTASPTPTPTVGCADSAPLKPYLVADDAAQKCQETIAKAGSVYLKKDLKAVQKCLKAFQKGTFGGDPLALCVGTIVGTAAATLPSEPVTNAKISAARAKAEELLDAKCTDATVEPLRLCSPTLAGLKDCLHQAYRQRIIDAIDSQYGTPTQSTDPDVRRCQNAIAGAARKYITSVAKTSQKCLNARNRACETGDAAALCVGSFAGGSNVPPTDSKAADLIAKAEAKLRAKILTKCTDAQTAALDSCGTTVADTADCIVCSHRAGFYGLIGDQYGGADVFADPSITLQAAVDAANPGDTIMLDPGIYPEAVSITTDNLHLLGQKSCMGGRAILRNTSTMANGIFAAGVDGLVFEGFQAEDYEENDIFVTGANGVTFRDLITTGPGTETGTEYGIFPILSNNILIEDCLVTGVRDAGIYVGQSTNIVVRNNEVHSNVAGIEIENSGNAQVYGNYAHDNTGGILLFKLPGLLVQLSNCHQVFDNIVENNNVANFGSGTVGLVPQGTGIIALSNDDTIFRDNEVTGNHSIGISVTDQDVLNGLFDPPPFPMTSPDYLVANAFFRGNVVTGNGTNPDPALGVISGDLLFVAPGQTGSCEDGNTVGIDFGGFFGALPACADPLTLPAGCPVPPLL